MAKILVIEDSHELAEALEDILTVADHQPYIALSGKEGLALAFSEHPDLILLDIKLPDTTGYEIYRKLREDSWGKDVKIIIITASESVEDIAKNLQLPLTQVMFKPAVSVQEILEKVKTQLSQ